MKRGTVREDGKVYFRKSKGKELWLTPEAYKNALNKEYKYRQKCLEIYKSLKKIKRSFGEYDAQKNLYFIKISSSGKEVWRPKAWYERFRDKQNKNKRKHYEKLKSLPKVNVKVGDVHPNNPDLFVLYKNGNKITYGNSKKLEHVIESRRILVLKRDIKNKKMRQKALDGIQKIKKGTVNPENNLIFWHYNEIGKEKWVTKEVFEKKMNHLRIKRKMWRKNKNLNKESQTILIKENNI